MTLPIGLYLTLQVPAFQTSVARYAAAKFSKELEAEVSIGRVYYLFFNRLIVTNLSVRYNQEDEIVNAEKISLKVRSRSLLKGRFSFSTLQLHNGQFNIVNESDSTTNLDRLFGRVEKEGEPKDSFSPPRLYIRELKLENFSFSLTTPFAEERREEEFGIDFKNISVEKINLTITNLHSSPTNGIRANINKLNCLEQSGYKIEQLSAALTFNSEGVSLTNFLIEDGFSRLKGERLSFSPLAPDALKEFTERIFIEANFSNSLLNFNSLAYFAPSLQTNKLNLSIDGAIKGSVNSLRADGLEISSLTNITKINLDARIVGLPNIEETIAFVDVNSSTTTTKDLSTIIGSIGGKSGVEALERLSPLINYNFKGRLAGLLDDFVANGTIQSSVGALYIDLLLKENRAEGGVELHGLLNTDNLKLGSIIGNQSLEEITLQSSLSALLRDESRGGSNFTLDTLAIKKATFNGYQYENIAATGSYQQSRFDGKVLCRDPNLNFLFQGIVGFSDKGAAYYDFYADLIYANLAALKFDSRDSLSLFSFKTLANFSQNSDGEIEGTINVKDLLYSNSGGEYNIGDISLQSTALKERYSLFLRSNFANITYRGSNFIDNFIDKLLNITVRSNLDALFPKKEESKRGGEESYSFSMRFNDSRAISQFLLPGLFVANGTQLDIEIGQNELIDLTLKSDRVGFNNNYSNGLSIEIKGGRNNLDANISSEILQLSGIRLDSNSVRLNLEENRVKIESEYINRGELENRLNFLSDIRFNRPSVEEPLITDINIYPSQLFFNGESWLFSKSKVVNQGSTFVFHNLDVTSGEQRLTVDGIVSPNPMDELIVTLNEIDISPLNNFIKDSLSLGGRVTGKIFASNIIEEPQIDISLIGNNLEMNHKEVGEIEIESNWDNFDKEFKIDITNRLAKSSPLKLKGSYTPKSDSLNLKASLDKISLAYFEPFLVGVISNSEGTISGEFSLEGPLNQLALSSKDCFINNLSFLVDFTNVRYNLSGPVEISHKGLSLDGAVVEDRFGNIGRVSGGLKYNYFKNIVLNTTIQFNNLEALNTQEGDNPDFYGRAFGTGRIAITGALDKILMNIGITSNRNTSIHIPLTSASDATDKNLLTFVESSPLLFNSKGELLQKEDPKRESQIEVELKVNVTPDAALYIEIDKSVGDVIIGYGTGLISLDIKPAKEIFSIQGDYRVDRGSYKFVLQGFIERDFILEQGGNIGFNGDLMKTDINIAANYKTKASLNTLLSDTTSISSRRNVNCKIEMSGKLLNPRLGFAIEIPDIDPLTKARVNAALNTEDKVVRQVMSLLVSGSFIPDVQSAIVNNSTLLYSNATEVLSNQINKIFTQLEIPLDLSFNYQPGQNGRDLFDAAISAQLFNNRVIVNGNIGSAKYMDRGGDVVGDIDVEIKLDDRGRFRAKAFSHSADQYSNYLDNSQRNGVGLVYQEEFSSLRELFQSLFIKRKRGTKRKKGGS